MSRASTAVRRALNPELIPTAFALQFLCAGVLAAAQEVAPERASPVAGAQAPVTEPVLAPDFEPLRFGDDLAHSWTQPFVPGASYSDAVTRPEAFLGQPVGSRIASHDEILALLRLWDRESERLVVLPYGQTYEGRPLVRAILTSPANHARLVEVRAGIQRLFDPRGLDDTEAERLVTTLPAVAWMGYGIHGDETSASEAALPIVHHLVASLDADVATLLDEVVIVLDPCLNPDGRERIRSMVVQNAGYRVNLDHAAMQRGRWPNGRGNHYLLDMNRDWMAGEAPETRGRWRALLDLPPQLFVDAHEMSGLDTFLFYPQSSPKNPHLPVELARWQGVLADDTARAFDTYGWGYYTREWADAWAPIYSDAWGSLTGAIGMLYEQGRTIGAPLRRASGEVVAYRESVHGQVTASLANLATFRVHRVAILRDWLAHRRLACTPPAPWNQRVFAVVPGPDVERHARFLRTLVEQGIEVFAAEQAFEAQHVVGAFGAEHATHSFPAGTWLVPAAQPQGALVRAFLDFDPRIDAETLRIEREHLERGKGSKLYDITGWDLGRQYGLDAWWCDTPAVERMPLRELRAPRGPVGVLEDAYAFVIDGDDGRSLRFVAEALELGLAVHTSDRAFRATVATQDSSADAPDGAAAKSVVRAFPRGSFVLRRHENRVILRAATGLAETEPALESLIARAAEASGAVVWCATTGRSTDDGPDLGGQHFHLLARPRVGLLSNTPVATTDFGALWRYLDAELHLHTSLLDCQSFGRVDLRRFNVLVLPPGATRALERHAADLRAWVEAGGTLVAVGDAASALASEPFELSSNVPRAQALADLDAYSFLVKRERAALAVEVDSDALYARPRPAESGTEAGATPPGEKAAATDAASAPEKDSDTGTDSATKPDKPDKPDKLDKLDKLDKDVDADPDAQREEAWKARFSPAGVILAAAAHPEAWITAGLGADLAVEFSGDDVWLTTGTPAVRLARAEDLRLGGLLWPEARERIADSAWLTVERRGAGQVIAFRGHPVFRGSWRGTARLFGNAVVVGPGRGAEQPLPR